MAYEIKSGPLPPSQERMRTRGVQPMYPFRDMEVEQWILVPRTEEHRLKRAARNVKYNQGIHIQIQLSADGAWWIATRKQADRPRRALRGMGKLTR